MAKPKKGATLNDDIVGAAKSPESSDVALGNAAVVPGDRIAAAETGPDRALGRTQAAEARLREERDFFSAVLEATSALIAVVDLDGRILRWNRACEQASGYAASEVEGRSFWDLGLLPNADLDIFRRTYERALAEGRAEGENFWRHRNGRLRRIAWTNVVMLDRNGQPSHLVASGIDVTARRNAEEALSAQNDLLNTVLDTTPAIVMVSDIQGRIIRFNRRCEETTGYRFDEVEGRTIFDLVLPPEDVEPARAVFARLVSGESPIPAETSWRHRDGSQRLMSWNTAVVRDDTGAVRYVISAAVDVTERRAAEATAQARREDLARLHRLHTAGELAGVLAHELNQPLAAIAGYSESALLALEGEGNLPDVVRENLEKIGQQAMRAGRFMRQLRRFMAKGEPTVRPENLNTLVERGGELVAPLARRRNVRVRLDSATGLPYVLVSEIQIEHVVANLVRNAIEAIADAGMRRGEVVVATRVDPPGMARVSITDTGPGVAAGEVEKIFEPFVSSKPTGLGLGLRISRSLIEAHGGRLWCEAGPGGRFHFTLPFAP